MTNPSRISRQFADLRRTGEMGLIQYLTAGDPSLASTEHFVLALAQAGACAIAPGVTMYSHGLDTIFLAAPTSTDERLALIAKASSGFLYLISRTGVTGAKDQLAEELPALARRVRRVTELPIAVGFGISQPGHVSVLGGLADAAVVGSALVEEIERATSVEVAADALAARVKLLKGAAVA